MFDREALGHGIPFPIGHFLLFSATFIHVSIKRGLVHTSAFIRLHFFSIDSVTGSWFERDASKNQSQLWDMGKRVSIPNMRQIKRFFFLTRSVNCCFYAG